MPGAAGGYLFILLEVWFLAQPLWKRFAPKSLLPVVFNPFLQGPVQPEKWLKASTEEFPPAFINPQTVRCCRCDFMQQDPHYHKTASTGVNSAHTLQTAWIPEDQARTCPHDRGDPEEKQEKRNKRYWCHYVTSLWALKLVITQTHLYRLKKKKKSVKAGRRCKQLLYKTEVAPASQLSFYVLPWSLFAGAKRKLISCVAA